MPQQAQCDSDARHHPLIEVGQPDEASGFDPAKWARETTTPVEAVRVKGGRNADAAAFSGLVSSTIRETLRVVRIVLGCFALRFPLNPP